MPVYNGGSYFELALQSALAQTYRDFEIVIVNDGSTDGGQTDALCQRYAALHPDRITYILQDNAGVGGALNAGVAAMTGDIFCWLSHDDLYEPHKLESQVRFFRRLGRPDAMLISDYALIDSDGAILHDLKLDHYAALASPRLPLLRGWINGCTVFVPAALMKRPGGPFGAQYRHVQDYRLWLDLLDRHEFFHQPERLVRYRVHPGQDSRKPEAITEGESLWDDMILGLSPAMRAQVSGSDWRFFEETRAHVEKPYPATATMAQARRDAAIETSLVSVILIGDDAQAAASVRAQTHPGVEVVQAGGDLPTALLRTHGDYIAFFGPGQRLEPERIARQLAAMQRSGAQISRAGADGVMVHRLLVAEGWTVADDDLDAAFAEAGRRRPWLVLDAPVPETFDPEPFRLAARQASEPAPWLGESVERMLWSFREEDRAAHLDKADLALEPPRVKLKHRLPDGDGCARFTTGLKDWDYVAELFLPPGDNRFLKVTVSVMGERAYVLLVDENFAQVGRREVLLPSPIPWRLWFDLKDFPGARTVVIQAGDVPRESLLELHRVRVFAAGL